MTLRSGLTLGPSEVAGSPFRELLHWDVHVFYRFLICSDVAAGCVAFSLRGHCWLGTCSKILISKRPLPTVLAGGEPAPWGSGGTLEL